MLSPLPRRSDWACCFAHSPSRVSLPRYGCRVGLRIDLFEACSAFTRVTACTLALSPYFVTRLSEGFSHFVTSMTAPVASGWSVRRVGLAPTGKAPPYHGARQERSHADGNSGGYGLTSIRRGTSAALAAKTPAHTILVARVSIDERLKLARLPAEQLAGNRHAQAREFGVVRFNEEHSPDSAGLQVHTRV